MIFYSFSLRHYLSSRVLSFTGAFRKTADPTIDRFPGMLRYRAVFERSPMGPRRTAFSRTRVAQRARTAADYGHRTGGNAHAETAQEFDHRTGVRDVETRNGGGRR